MLKKILFPFIVKKNDFLEKKWRHRLLKVIFFIFIGISGIIAFFLIKDSQFISPAIFTTSQMGEYFPNITLEQENKLRERIKENMPDATGEERYAKAQEIMKSWEARGLIPENKSIFYLISNYLIIFIFLIVILYIENIILQLIYFKGIIYIIYGDNKNGKRI